MNDTAARQAGRAVVWRALSFLSSRGLSSLRTVILGWLLTREDFGTLAVAVSALELLLSLSNFGFEPALVQAKAPTRDHFDAGWTLRLSRSAVIAALLGIGGSAVATWYGQPDAAAVVSVLALRPVLDSAMSIGLVDLQRRLDFRPAAITGLARGMVDIVVAVALAQRLGVWALVIGQLAGAFAACVASYVVAPWRPRLVLRRELNATLLRFGRWVFAAVAVGTATTTLLQVLVSRRLGPEALGVFFMALRLGTLIPNAIGAILDDVGISVHAARQDELGYRGRVFRFTVLNTLAVLAPASLASVAVMDRLVPSVLGSEWAAAGWPVALLVVAGVVAVYHDGAGTMFLGTGHPRYRVWLEIVRFLVTLTAAAVLLDRWQVEGAAAALVAGEVGILIVASILARRVTHMPLSEVFMPAVVILAAAGLGAAIALLVATPLDGAVTAWVGAAVGSLIAYALVARIDRDLDFGLRRSIAALVPRAATTLGLAR